MKRLEASKSGGGKWMSTKKRGRDDEQIHWDSNKAKAARRRKTTKNSATKRKQQCTLDDFVVEDDESIDAEYLSESEVEEKEEDDGDGDEAVLILKSAKRSTATTEASSDESLSEAESTFMGGYPKRTSRPSEALKAATTGKRPTEKGSKSKPVVSRKRSKTKQHGNFHNDSSDEPTLQDTPVKERSNNKTQNCQHKRMRLKTKSKTDVQPKKLGPIELLEDSSDDELKMMQKRLAASKKSPSQNIVITLKEAGLSPPSAQAKENQVNQQPKKLALTKKFQTESKSRYFASCLTDSEDNSSAQPHGRESSKQRAKVSLDDYVGDREATEIAQALKLSEASYSIEQSKRSIPIKKKGSPVIELQDEDEEEQSDNDVEMDEYVDNREAKSVLDAANDLSAKVLLAMARWSKQHSNNATKGMIVDGALALFNFDSSNASDHAWISQEVMQKVCPKVKLADYQLIGVNWLALLHGMKSDIGEGKQTNVNGVLADSMGLGKTVQTIAFLAWLKYRNSAEKVGKSDDTIEIDDTDDEDVSRSVAKDTDVRPHIIIVPASVLSNWENEFKKFCPDMRVVRYHGTQTERQRLRRDLKKYQTNKTNSKIDVILTTFSYFSSEKSDDRGFLRKFNFDYMVVDEAHCLKNPKGMRYKNMNKFSTSHRLLLTGTPVQNSPKELMSLLCFLMPLFSRPSMNDWDNDSANDGGEHMLRHFITLEGGGSATEEAAYSKLKQLFAPFVLRRRKEDVMNQILPPKTKRVEVVPFDDSTRQVYDSILAHHVNKRENGWTVMSAGAQQHLFTALRKAANHPLLLRSRHKAPNQIDHLARNLMTYGYFGTNSTCTTKLVKAELENFSDFDIHCVALEMIEEDPAWETEMGRYRLDVEDLFSSPKFSRLRTLLPSLICDDHRILIFSQWTKCLDLLGCLLESMDLRFLRLDGQTPIGERQKLIDKFNTDSSIPVFLLSTRAGGLGINLTSADTCILHDLDFNPFNDLQAEDRCHRIGQKKPVTVIKMVTKDTVDSDIYEMQERKAKMNAAILDRGGSIAPDKKEDEEEVKKVLQKTMDRYLLSPRKTAKVAKI